MASFCDEWLILDIHATEEITGDNMDGWNFWVGSMCGLVAYAADEAATFYDDVDVGGYEELDAAAEGVDINLLVFSDNGLAQVHADAAAEGIKTGTVEGLAAIDVLVAAIMYRAPDALAVLADGQWSLEPLVWVATIAVDNEVHTHVEHHKDAEISCPGLFGYLFKPTPMDKVPNGCQFQQTGDNENNSDNRSWFHNSIHIKLNVSGCKGSESRHTLQISGINSMEM